VFPLNFQHLIVFRLKLDISASFLPFLGDLRACSLRIYEVTAVLAKNLQQKNFAFRVTMKANEGQQLSQILSSVLPVTEILRSTGHGSCEGSASYLALAVHCVLINEGFEVHTETSHASEYLSLKENLYTLPSDWKPTSRPCETEVNLDVVHFSFDCAAGCGLNISGGTEHRSVMV